MSGDQTLVEMTLKKLFKSETNFTSEFFSDGDDFFKSVTRKFNNPGYKIASGPIEVEFMLQVCSITWRGIHDNATITLSTNLIDFKLQDINDIDLHGEYMDSTINIHMSWRDSRLSWDPSIFGDIRSIHLSPELIWHPIFSIVNRLNEFSPFDERFNKAEIDHEGTEAWNY